MAYRQLLQYREDLENPPLLVVCDFDIFEVHTNYTNTMKQVYKFSLADLIPNQPTATCKLAPLEVLRACELVRTIVANIREVMQCELRLRRASASL